ncbi:hypothetical protein J2T12_005455 [Paenibacillus anaericanus]|uniref:hypothetical protein n=1 Tax=Paenibacillus anaericanus TaxID=170367 RepID=UPI0027825F11|nr:hypothetical protein [Paenibacillus anaericanus]MDQ0092011.1 hypothetical protein [Paenibacillus anaericanus]
MGTMILKRFNGIEKFKLLESRAYVVRRADETIMMWFETETDSQAIMSVDDTANFERNPNAEITIYLDKLILKEFGIRTLNSRKDITKKIETWMLDCIILSIKM